MGRSLTKAIVSSQLNASVNTVVNPYSGVFGSGNIRVYATSDTFIVPATSVRVRCFGGGGKPDTTTIGLGGGGGGGFCLKTITGLVINDLVTITVGLGGAINASGGTSSFGAYCSATGGVAPTANGGGVGGSGVGGDINYTGGVGGLGTSTSYAGGGGGANLFGNGGKGGGGTSNKSGASGASGGGAGSAAGSQLYVGGNGAFSSAATPSFQCADFGGASVDYLGTGSGGYDSDALSVTRPGVNGGGGAGGTDGGSGGGGGAFGGSQEAGGNGLVIIEW